VPTFLRYILTDLDYPGGNMRKALFWAIIFLKISECPSETILHSTTCTHTNVAQIGRNVGTDLDYPGDVRMVYTLYNTSEASALAKQTASTFAPWEGPYDKSYTMFMVEDGIRSADEMLRDAEAQNAACELRLCAPET
jgi:hypothetical protein